MRRCRWVTFQEPVIVLAKKTSSQHKFQWNVRVPIMKRTGLFFVFTQNVLLIFNKKDFRSLSHRMRYRQRRCILIVSRWLVKLKPTIRYVSKSGTGLYSGKTPNKKLLYRVNVHCKWTNGKARWNNETN
jgi:hypothetical protein